MAMQVRQAVSPQEARKFDTAALRESFLFTEIFVPGSISLTYSHFDRTIIGGAMPGAAELILTSSKPVGADPFLSRRELGIFNVGGEGTVLLDGQPFVMQRTNCLYVPMGTANVHFASADPADPAKFYLVSAPAHKAYAARLISAEDANRVDLGAQPDANRRVLRQYIHPEICPSCQLVMGMTVIEDGSVWNTMPCHTHDRRSETYLYFDMAAQTRVFHFMGEPDETRHLVVANEQAIISPGWSIHCGAGTARYAFIWAMAGDNQDFNDMDFVAMEDLR